MAAASAQRGRDTSGSPRRVLVLINSVADTAGGSLRAAVNIAEAMAGAGTDVVFSAPVSRGQDHRTIELMDSRVERMLFSATRPIARFGGSSRQLCWLWRNGRTFDEVQVHSLFTLSAIYAIVLCSLRRTPVFLWAHGQLDPFDLRKHAWIKRVAGPVVTRRLLTRCAALLFTTSHESRIAITYGARTPHEVVALPVAPISTTGTDPASWRERHGVPADVPVVLFLGRIDYKKRLPLLIEALSHMERRDAHLVVVGDGPDAERARVAETADRCAVTDRVHLTGWLEGTDRLEAFSVADVFALLSDAENFGLSIIEAMSVGCPVVISDGVFLAEDLVRPGAAVCVERDALTAARAIDALLNRPDDAAKMGHRAQELVASAFAPPAVAARLSEVSQRWARVGSRNATAGG